MTLYGAPAAARHGSSPSRSHVAPMPMNPVIEPAMSATNARWLDGTGLGMGTHCTTFIGIKRVATGSLGEDTT
jgi:hypothetical protein